MGMTCEHELPGEGIEHAHAPRRGTWQLPYLPGFAAGLVEEAPGKDGGIVLVDAPVDGVLAHDGVLDVLFVDALGVCVSEEHSVPLHLILLHLRIQLLRKHPHMHTLALAMLPCVDLQYTTCAHLSGATVSNITRGVGIQGFQGRKSNELQKTLSAKCWIRCSCFRDMSACWCTTSVSCVKAHLVIKVTSAISWALLLALGARLAPVNNLINAPCCQKAKAY